ncbi:class I SAM-dependent methyltransferase [Shinella sp.]|uniref:class I SAM-dependent methyltransferase n=1 Tax=Shinella sp. TaxID=1870904 RepID=UPI0029A6FA83|nr:class I SAM-dependent methyltransferase [Shinella sp.]MDX3973852.1 class I SAM-dependent methyltransferase [Shinella sp.]
MTLNDEKSGPPGVGKPAFTAAHAGSYVEGTLKRVPGLAALHRMASMLIAERVAGSGRVLVLGAGGGLELKALADANPDWDFYGIDPSADMLLLAEETVGPHRPRVQLHQGYIDTAEEGPFDAAVCFLTLHFVARDQRLDTLQRVRRRLLPGAPFVVAHISFPQGEPERSMWIARHVAFGGQASGDAESARQAIATKLSILSPEEDEAMLREAGFSDVSLIYAGLTFRGWVAYA